MQVRVNLLAAMNTIYSSGEEKDGFSRSFKYQLSGGDMFVEFFRMR
jgi:hypothetical protein